MADPPPIGANDDDDSFSDDSASDDGANYDGYVEPVYVAPDFEPLRSVLEDLFEDEPELYEEPTPKECLDKFSHAIHYFHNKRCREFYTLIPRADGRKLSILVRAIRKCVDDLNMCWEQNGGDGESNVTENSALSLGSSINQVPTDPEDSYVYTRDDAFKQVHDLTSVIYKIGSLLKPVVGQSDPLWSQKLRNVYESLVTCINVTRFLARDEDQENDD